MKKIMFYLLICFMFIPSIVFAEGLEIEYIDPSYDTNQVTYVNKVEKPNVFDFTFTPQSKDMGYNIKITNNDDKIYYITNIDHTINPYVKVTYSGVEVANVIKPGEFKVLNVKFTMRNYPESDISPNAIKFFIEYDLAEKYIDTSDGEIIGGNNKLDENPPTGLFNYVKVILPIIVVLGISLYFINKKKKIFKTFVFIIIPLVGIIVIKNVNAEKTDKRLVITGNIDFKTLSKLCTDDCTDTPEDYGVYYVEVNPNEGLFNGSPNVYKANYYKGTTIDLSDIDRYQYKFISWNFNGTDTNFTNNILTINEKSLLKANWEFGPYYWLNIDPNGGIYEGSEKVYRFKMKINESYTLIDPTRDGYAFYKWNELSRTFQLIGGHMIVMGNKDITVSARWEGIYELTFDPGADDATVTPTKKEVANLFPYGELPTPERAGYTFDGWHLDGEELNAEMIFDKDTDVTAVAHWIANTDTKYRVKHWVTKIGKDASIHDEDNYELLEEIVLTGETDTKVTPEVKTMEGFTSPEPETANINGDESRVVNYYYSRNKYNLTLVVPEEGIREIKYMINGGNTWESTDSTLVLEVDYNSVYKAYAIAAEGYYYNTTKINNPFTGTMTIEPVSFSPIATICPAGTMCTDGPYEPTPCPAGTYAASAGSNTCTPCADGYYQTETGASSCNICPAGSKCSVKPNPPEPCPKGEYQNEEGKMVCKTCSSGSYQTETGQTSCNVCPKGSSCAEPDDPPTPCPTGKYQDKEGQTTCSACPGGQYSSSTGAISCSVCPAGSYSGVGSSSCNLCSVGQYQDKAGQTSCNTCPSGSYQTEKGQTTCNVCPKGSSCAEPDDPPTPCPLGQYQDKTGQTSCSACPAGQYSGTTVGATSCGTCSAGTYSTQGSSTCTNCPSGQYSSSAGSSSCTKCPGGKYSSSAGSTSCETCAAGKYSSEGSSTCTNCPAGQYSSSAGSSSCTKCPGGQYSSSAGSTSCGTCSAGSYSTEGSSSCTSCPTGKYSNKDGASSCTSCPAGTYASSRGSTTCSACLAGSYSTGGATTCSSCPGGKYSNINGATSCTNCPANTKSNSTSGSTYCVNCDTGYESSEGSTTCSLKTFTVKFVGSDTTSINYSNDNNTTMQISYGSSATKNITVKSTTATTVTYGYYISAISCDNGYIVDSIGYSALEGTVNNPSSYSIAVVIKNNNKLVGSTCTYTITNIKASGIDYSNSSYTRVTNVRDALDELYGKFN